MDWAQILVIILSIFLAIFLIAAIVLVALLIRVTQQIKKVTESAHRTMFSAEKFAASLSKASGPLVLLKLLAGQIKKRSNDTKSSKRRN